MKTYSAKPTDISRQWFLLDASEAPLGRMATKIATLLTGKYKPIFTQHIDCGDYVVVINADNLVATGNKMADKKYYRHSGYPGNLKVATLTEKVDKNSSEVVRAAVKGMLPKNKLLNGRMMRLKVYPNSEHEQTAQKPQKVSIK